MGRYWVTPIWTTMPLYPCCCRHLWKSKLSTAYQWDWVWAWVWIMKCEVSDEMASIRRKQVDGDRGERRRKESHLNKIIKQCGSYSHKHVVLQLIHPSYPIVDGCEGGADVHVAIRFSKISKIWNSQFTNSRNPKILSCSCETPTHLCIPSPFSSSSPLPSSSLVLLDLQYHLSLIILHGSAMMTSILLIYC